MQGNDKLFPKDMLVGILLSLTKNSIIVYQSNETKIGYKVRTQSALRGGDSLLQGVKRSLLQQGIESKFKERESKSRPHPILMITGIKNLHVLSRFMIDSLPVPEKHFRENGITWHDYEIVLDMLMKGKQHTQMGLDNILRIKGDL